MNWDWSASQRCVTDMNWELECQSPSRHLKTLATGVPANSWSLQVPVWHCVHHGRAERTDKAAQRVVSADVAGAVFPIVYAPDSRRRHGLTRSVS